MAALVSDELPAEFLEQTADFTTQYIHGIAVMGNMPFACPLITHVTGTLWQGGTPADAGKPLPPFFRAVLNLYPWVAYETDPATELRAERLYDAGEIASSGLIYELADWVNEKRALGPTLVHCQAGLNRSALVAALALMTGPEHLSSDAAITLLRAKRSPAVLCNDTFEAWLRAQG